MPFGEKNLALRDIAERHLERLQPRGAEIQSDTLKMLHELQVHQIELEMQSEELGKTLALCDALRAKYHDLYNYAPIGYLTISPFGIIFETNLAGGSLLGAHPDELAGRDVRTLLCDEGLQDLNALINRLHNASGDVFAYSVLLRKQPLPRYVNMQARAYVDPVLQEPRISLVLMDVTSLKSATDDICNAISDFGRLN